METSPSRPQSHSLTSGACCELAFLGMKTSPHLSEKIPTSQHLAPRRICSLPLQISVSGTRWARGEGTVSKELALGVSRTPSSVPGHMALALGTPQQPCTQGGL